MLEGGTLQLHGRCVCMCVHMCVGGHYVPFVLSFSLMISLEDVEMLLNILCDLKLFSESFFKEWKNGSQVIPEKA